MRFRGPRFGAVLFFFALAAGGADIAGARSSGELRGRVLDAGGAALAEVSIRLDHEETGAARSTATNARGAYRLGGLAAGRYRLTASRPGLQPVVRRRIRLGAGEVLVLDLRLAPPAGARDPAAAAPPPVLAPGRSSLEHRVGSKELEALPSADRDFTDLAGLAPGVRRDPIGGGLEVGGQRAFGWGLTVDGADAGSAFFGPGRSGEAVADGGLLAAADAIGEVRVVTAAVLPEAAAASGVQVDVVTRGGTRRLAGRAFFHRRDEDLKEDLQPSPLDRFEGRVAPAAPDDFARDHYGVSLGGPLARDRSHFLLAFDRSDRSEPFRRALEARGLYDAVLARAAVDPRFLALVAGFTPRADGVAAPDPTAGRTAEGLFIRELDQRVLFGRIDQRLGDAQELSGRFTRGSFERFSSFADEESRTRQETSSLVLTHLASHGRRRFTEARIQLAQDELDRSSLRVGQGIEARIDYLAVGADAGNAPAALGKPAFLPVRVEEERLELAAGHSLLVGDHGLKAGLDLGRDEARSLAAAGRDGEYRFATLADFLANEPEGAEIFFGDATFPGFDAIREVWAFYVQDRYRPGARLSLDYGLRLEGSRNPDGFEHLFAAGRSIPDESGNLAPRLGFVWTPDAAGRSLVRGGAGLFFTRVPLATFSAQARDNGLLPNAGRVAVAPGGAGYVPLGEEIDNQSPPPGVALAAAFVAPDFENAETLRLHLGFERELATAWSAGVDLIWAEGDELPETVDLNRTFTTDAAGRPIYSPTRPLTRGDAAGGGDGDDTPLGEVLTWRSIGESEYRALTLRVEKRFSRRYRLRAHYTWSEDRDTSSGERPPARVTLLRPDDPGFDFGFSDRDVKNRLVVSGLVELPHDFTLGAVYEHRGGRPFNPVDRAAGLSYCGLGSPGVHCPDVRPVGPDGRVLARNSFRNRSFDRLDLRVGKFFAFADRYRADVFVEVFNLFDEQPFEVDASPAGEAQRDPASEHFALASRPAQASRELQIGVRFAF